MGNLGGHGAEGRGDTHVFSLEYHGEAGLTVARQDMGDARGGSTKGSCGNVVGNDIHIETAGNRITLGRVADNIRIVRR